MLENSIGHEMLAKVNELISILPCTVVMCEQCENRELCWQILDVKSAIIKNTMPRAFEKKGGDK